MFTASLLNPRGRIGGTVTAEPEGFVFLSTDSKSTTFLYGECSVEFGGTGNRFIYLTNGSEQTLVVEDPAVLKESNVQYSRLAEKIAAITSKGNRRTVGRWILSIVALVIVGFAVVLALKSARSAIPLKIPRSVDFSLGDKLLPLVMNGAKPLEDSLSSAVLSEIKGKLVSANKLDSFPFKLTLVNNDLPNAFALPSGDIVIHSGLVTEAASVDELAGVIAHEMGHITARHHLRGAIDRIGLLLVVRVLVGLDAPAEFLKTTKDLSLLQYSREFENESDSLAVTYMKNAGFSPDQFAGFFTRLHKDQKIALPEFFSTHPDPAERSNRVKKLGGKPIPSCKTFSVSYTTYRNHLKSILSKEKER